MQKISLVAYTLLLFVAGSFSGTVYADVTVEAGLSHTSFSVDQMAQLTITVNGASRGADITLPQLEKITLHNRGKSSQVNMVNGTISSSLAHNYLVQADEPGSYTLPPVHVKVSGRDYMTEPLQFTVTAADRKNRDSGGTGQNLDEIAFLRVTEAGTHYPGEIVPITVKAYFNQKYRFDEISLPALEADGIASPQIKENPAKTQETVNGRAYHVLTWNTTLSGVKAGRQTVKFTLDGSLLIPQQRKRQSPFGDPFFDDSVFSNFFGGYQRRPLTLESNETEFAVLGLPALNKPVDFTGAIGRFDMEVSASPLKLAVGEPVTLKIKISGDGNFDRVEAPEFPENQAWKSYPPTTELLTDQDGKVSGKVFEQAIVVRDATAQEISSLSFSFFDPELKDYVTRVSEPIPIELQNVAQAIAAAPSTMPKSETVKPGPVKDEERFHTLAPIQLETGKFSARLMPVYKRPWYLLTSLATLLAFCAILFLKWQRSRNERNPEIVQNRKRRQLLKENMRRLSVTAESGDTSQFLQECRKIIQLQLGQAWRMEPAAISSADLADKLAKDSPLLDIFTRTEAAAYGAAEISRKDIQTFLTTLSTELENLT
jgi:hypothetical protein